MKRKVALLVGYNGMGYSGLQWNKDMNTIEKAVLDKLTELGLVSEANSEDAKKVALKSSSRTDKGVHASFNVICLKINRDPDEELVVKIREALHPLRIHLYGIKRIPRRLIAHKTARSRVYSYTVPTAVLQVSNILEEAKLLREMDLGSVKDVLLEGSSIEVQAEGRSFVEVQAEKSSVEEQTKESSIEEQSEKSSVEEQSEKSSVEEQSGICSDINSVEEIEKTEENKRKLMEREYTIEKILHNFKNVTTDVSLFRKLMKIYEGTHKFHNFTVKSNKNGIKRYIKSITVSDPFVENGIEYVEVVIHGQSFLLHQIRKMISFAVLNTRYASGWAVENFERVFESEMHVPKAPSEYLYLREVTFEDYNNRTEEKLVVDEAERKAFEESVLGPAVRNEQNLVSWEKFFDAVRFHHDKMDYLFK